MGAQALAEGLKIGPYRIIRQLGSGGMGDVYLANEERLARQVALKLISPEIARNSSTLRRFESEGRSLALINHKNVVSVYAIDKIDGYNFISMEYIEGKSLSELTRNLAFPAKEAVPIFTQIVEGLAALHDKSVVHRDLKPGNILYSRDSVAKIIDLGIAKAFNDSQMSSTTAGVVVGTVQFLAPEIIMGQPATALSDIWALGAIFYEFLTGRQLIKASNFAQALNQVMNLKIEYPPEAVADIPAEMRTIIDKMCAREIEKRYKSAREVARDLRKFSQVHPSEGKWVFPHCGRDIANAAAIKQNLAAKGHSEYAAKLIMFTALHEIDMTRSLQIDPAKTQVLAASNAETLTDRHLNSAIRTISRVSTTQRLLRARKFAIKAAAGLITLAVLGTGVGAYINSLPPAQSPFATATPKVMNSNLEIILKPDSTPVLAWDSFKNAAKYNLEIAADKGFSQVTANFELQETKYNWTSAVPGIFYWRVRALDEKGQTTAPSDPGRLQLSVTSPVLPAELQAAVDKPAHLSWSANAFQTKFKVQTASDPQFNRITRTETVSREAHDFAFKEAGKYFVRVAALGAQKTVVSEYSNPVTIEVTGAAHTGSPTLMAPPNEAKMPFNGGDVTILLFWSKSEGAQTYEIQVSRNENFSRILTTQFSKTNRFTLKQKMPAGVIYWRVRSKGASGASPWSSTSHFELQ